MKKLGANLRDIREVMGMEQQELARSTGVSSSTISLIESGKRDPSLKVLIQIRRALNVSWAGLLRGIE